MIKNEDLSWSDVSKIPTGSGTVGDAFQLKYGFPSKEMLTPSVLLYKFSSYNTLALPPVIDSTILSPWWSPYFPFKHDGGFIQKREIAKLNGVSLREWARLTSVIKENWSSLNWLITINPKTSIYAWFGNFSSMPRCDEGHASFRDHQIESSSGSLKLPGGATQFYIPNLTHADIQFSSCMGI